MVLPPIDKKFIKEKVVIDQQNTNTANHDFTRYSIYDTDADQKDLIMTDTKKHFDRRGIAKKVQSSTENEADRIQL